MCKQVSITLSKKKILVEFNIFVSWEGGGEGGGVKKNRQIMSDRGSPSQ